MSILLKECSSYTVNILTSIYLNLANLDSSKNGSQYLSCLSNLENVEEVVEFYDPGFNFGYWFMINISITFKIYISVTYSKSPLHIDVQAQPSLSLLQCLERCLYISKRSTHNSQVTCKTQELDILNEGRFHLIVCPSFAKFFKIQSKQEACQSITLPNSSIGNKKSPMPTCTLTIRSAEFIVFLRIRISFSGIFSCFMAE